MTSQSKLILFLSSSLLLSSFSFALEKSPQPRDERFDDQLQLAKPDLSTQKPQIPEKRDDKHTLSMTKEELAKHPDLIVRGLIPAVLQNNGDVVQLLLRCIKICQNKIHFYLSGQMQLMLVKMVVFRRR